MSTSGPTLSPLNYHRNCQRQDFPQVRSVVVVMIVDLAYETTSMALPRGLHSDLG
jgi:hypothetical protein